MNRRAVHNHLHQHLIFSIFLPRGTHQAILGYFITMILPPTSCSTYTALHPALLQSPFSISFPPAPREASPSNLQLCHEPAACPQPQLTALCPAPILDLSTTKLPALRSGPLAFSHPAEIPVEIHVLTAWFLQPVLRLGTQPHLTTYLPAVVPLRFCLICLLFQSNASFCTYLLVFSSASKQSHSCALSRTHQTAQPQTAAKHTPSHPQSPLSSFL